MQSKNIFKNIDLLKKYKFDFNYIFNIFNNLLFIFDFYYIDNIKNINCNEKIIKNYDEKKKFIFNIFSFENYIKPINENFYFLCYKNYFKYNINQKIMFLICFMNIDEAYIELFSLINMLNENEIKNLINELILNHKIIYLEKPYYDIKNIDKYFSNFHLSKISNELIFYFLTSLDKNLKLKKIEEYNEIKVLNKLNRQIKKIHCKKYNLYQEGLNIISFCFMRLYNNENNNQILELIKNINLSFFKKWHWSLKLN